MHVCDGSCCYLLNVVHLPQLWRVVCHQPTNIAIIASTLTTTMMMMMMMMALAAAVAAGIYVYNRKLSLIHVVKWWVNVWSCNPLALAALPSNLPLLLISSSNFPVSLSLPLPPSCFKFFTVISSMHTNHIHSMVMCQRSENRKVRREYWRLSACVCILCLRWNQNYSTPLWWNLSRQTFSVKHSLW